MECEMSSSHEIKQADSDRTEILVFDLRSTTDAEPSDEDHMDTADTFRALSEAKLKPRFISEESCLKAERRGAIYVFSVFRGRAFECLKQRGCRVYGTPIVMQCILEIDRLPKVDYPVFSKTLVGARICCTGLEAHERDPLKEKILWMSGQYSGHFTNETTHLIAESCDYSPKYIEAVRLQIPVMKKAWITESLSWKLGKTAMTSPEMTEHYKLPVFTNLVIAASGLSMGDLSAMSRLIERHGGKFATEMKKGKCTHLVVGSSCGERFKKAKQWGMKTVTSRWIRKCVEKGVRLVEREYAPTRSQQGCKVMESTSFLESPRIVFKQQRQTSTTNENLQKLSMERLVQTSFEKREKLCDVQKRYCGVDPVENLDTTNVGMFNSLVGCGVVMCGFTEQNMRKWKPLLGKTGASRRPAEDIDSPCITHIVLGPEPVEEKTLQSIERRSSTLPVVTPHWLVQCVKLRARCSHLEFLHPMFVAREDRNAVSFVRTAVSSSSALLTPATRNVKCST